jgi:hypothetical protein
LFVEDAPITKPFRAGQIRPRVVRKAEKILIFIAGSLILVSFLLTLIRNF